MPQKKPIVQTSTEQLSEFQTWSLNKQLSKKVHQGPSTGRPALQVKIKDSGRMSQVALIDNTQDKDSLKMKPQARPTVCFDNTKDFPTAKEFPTASKPESAEDYNAYRVKKSLTPLSATIRDFSQSSDYLPPPIVVPSIPHNVHSDVSLLEKHENVTGFTSSSSPLETYTQAIRKDDDATVSPRPYPTSPKLTKTKDMEYCNSPSPLRSYPKHKNAYRLRDPTPRRTSTLRNDHVRPFWTLSELVYAHKYGYEGDGGPLREPLHRLGRRVKPNRHAKKKAKRRQTKIYEKSNTSPGSSSPRALPPFAQVTPRGLPSPTSVSPRTSVKGNDSTIYDDPRSKPRFAKIPFQNRNTEREFESGHQVSELEQRPSLTSMEMPVCASASVQYDSRKINVDVFKKLPPTPFIAPPPPPKPCKQTNPVHYSISKTRPLKSTVIPLNPPPPPPPPPPRPKISPKSPPTAPSPASASTTTPVSTFIHPSRLRERRFATLEDIQALKPNRGGVKPKAGDRSGWLSQTFSHLKIVPSGYSSPRANKSPTKFVRSAPPNTFAKEDGRTATFTTESRNVGGPATGFARPKDKKLSQRPVRCEHHTQAEPEEERRAASGIDSPTAKNSMKAGEFLRHTFSIGESKTRRRQSSDASFACQGIQNNTSSIYTEYKDPGNPFDSKKPYYVEPERISNEEPGRDSRRPRYEFKNSSESDISKLSEQQYESSERDTVPQPLLIRNSKGKGKASEEVADDRGGTGSQIRDTRFYQPYDDVLREYES